MDSNLSILKNYLQRFYPISDDEFGKVAPHFFMKDFKVKECLISENEVEENIYFIIKGVLRKFFRKDKHEIITQFYQEGDFAHAAISFYTGVPSPYIIEAIEAGLCVGIGKIHFEKLLNELPAMEKLYRRVLTNLYVKKDLNEYQIASQTKKERFISFCKEQPDLLQRVPQKYLASYLQMAPETFCRLKNTDYKRRKEGPSMENHHAA